MDFGKLGAGSHRLLWYCRSYLDAEMVNYSCLLVVRTGLCCVYRLEARPMRNEGPYAVIECCIDMVRRSGDRMVCRHLMIGSKYHFAMRVPFQDLLRRLQPNDEQLARRTTLQRAPCVRSDYYLDVTMGQGMAEKPSCPISD
jgi:hypothetical protein